MHLFIPETQLRVAGACTAVQQVSSVSRSTAWLRVPRARGIIQLWYTASPLRHSHLSFLLSPDLISPSPSTSPCGTAELLLWMLQSSRVLLDVLRWAAMCLSASPATTTASSSSCFPASLHPHNADSACAALAAVACCLLSPHWHGPGGFPTLLKPENSQHVPSVMAADCRFKTSAHCIWGASCYQQLGLCERSHLADAALLLGVSGSSSPSRGPDSQLLTESANDVRPSATVCPTELAMSLHSFKGSSSPCKGWLCLACLTNN